MKPPNARSVKTVEIQMCWQSLRVDSGAPNCAARRRFEWTTRNCIDLRDGEVRYLSIIASVVSTVLTSFKEIRR